MPPFREDEVLAVLLDVLNDRLEKKRARVKA